MLNAKMFEEFENEYETKILSISMGMDGLQCHLDDSFGKLPVSEIVRFKRESEEYPFQVETVIDGVKYFYITGKEDC